MLSKEDIDKLQETYGPVEHVVGPKEAWEVVLRRPLRKEYKAFRAYANDPRSKAEAQEYLIKSCLVYPAKDQAEAFLDKFYAVPEDPKVQAALRRLMDVNQDGGLIQEEEKQSGS